MKAYKHENVYFYILRYLSNFLLHLASKVLENTILHLQEHQWLTSWNRRWNEAVFWGMT